MLKIWLTACKPWRRELGGVEAKVEMKAAKNEREVRADI
jgi:hypothetical protein